MRYSRNTKIFRGGVDAAPFAGVFFLVLMFVMLFYSQIFFPGVPIKLSEIEGAPEMVSRSVKVLASRKIEFQGELYSYRQFRGELAIQLQKGTLPKRMLIEREPLTDPILADAVEDQLIAAGVALKLPGARLELPDDAGFPGAANPVVVVGINLNGQIFFQHQLVSEAVLKERLTAAARQTAQPMTLLLQADKNVPTEKIVRLSQIANRAGISELRIQTKPART
jgi:biopolymer transport protein ExbD